MVRSRQAFTTETRKWQEWVEHEGQRSGQADAFGESTAVRNAAISASSLHAQTIDHVRLAIRLVNLDGHVVWTTTQESKGAKYKGASADADMGLKQLRREATKSEGGSPEVVEKKP